MLILRLTAVMAVLAVAGAASAEQLDDVNAARTHYKKGTRAFELGHYSEAIKEYEAAYEAKDDPALLYNIGQAYRLSGNNAEALRAYKMYLHRLPEAGNADEVRGRILELQKTIDEQHAKPSIPAAPPATEPATPPTTTPVPAVHELANAQPPPVDHPRPVYKKWWFWTTAGVVVAGGLAVGLAVGLAKPTSSERVLPPVTGAP